MNDDEINADDGGAMPGDFDEAVDLTWVDWRAMDDYVEDDQLVLTMASPTSQLFGRRQDGVWLEMVDGIETAKPDYRPTQWTRVPPERWKDWADG